jgi:2-C-methyl-D-erythritol 4-phosphate cytidylyltransferase
MLAWSYDVLKSAGCDPVVVVVPDAASDSARTALGNDALLIVGGSTRTESVRIGLSLVESEWVVVHDGVRPLVTVDLINSVVDALLDADGAIAAVPIDETIKQAKDRDVLATVDRKDLWAAQTPQAFRTAVLRSAHDRAGRDGVAVTDDAQLVEQYGGRVVLVAGDRTNLKVTWPADFDVAEALLKTRSDRGATL